MTTTASDGATVMLTSGASGRINALLSLRSLRSAMRLINAFFLILLLPFRGRWRCMESPEKGGGKEDKASATAGKVVRVPAAMKKVAAVVDKDVAARRALAIKRVVEGNRRGIDGTSMRENSLFFTSRGDALFTQSWTPVKIPVRCQPRQKPMSLHNPNNFYEAVSCFLLKKISIQHIGTDILVYGQ